MTDKITQAELREIFGESMPVQALEIVGREGRSIDEIRAELKALAARTKVEKRASLLQRCKEIRDWHKTGFLTGDALRSFARALPNADAWDMGSLLARAENETARELMDLFIEQQARPLWREIDLSKAVKHEHPDISTEKHYLVKIHGGWFFGRFTRQWFGLNFTNWGNAGAQFDAPGWNSSTWEYVFEVEPERLIGAAL